MIIGKGAAFERTISERFSMWVTPGHVRKDIFWRSAMSGGRATVLNRGNAASCQSQAGDLIPTDPLGNLLLKLFVVECKFWKKIGWDDLLFGSRASLILLAWNKLLDECAPTNRRPFLVAKQNYKDELVGTNEEGLRVLTRGLNPDRALDIRCEYRPYGMYVITLNSILVNVNFDRIRKRFRIAGDEVLEVPELLCASSSQLIGT